MKDLEPEYIVVDHEANTGAALGGVGGVVAGIAAGAVMGPAGMAIGGAVGGIAGALVSGVAVHAIESNAHAPNHAPRDEPSPFDMHNRPRHADDLPVEQAAEKREKPSVGPTLIGRQPIADSYVGGSVEKLPITLSDVVEDDPAQPTDEDREPM